MKFDPNIVFLILLFAALPWLGRGEGLDPHALPDDLLPVQ